MVGWVLLWLFFLFENWIEWGFRFVCLLSRCGVVVIRQLNIICFTISHHPYDKIMMTMIRNLMKLQLFFGTHQQNQINQEKKFVVVLVNTEVVELSVGLCMHFQFVFFLVGIRFGQRFSGPHFFIDFFSSSKWRRFVVFRHPSFFPLGLSASAYYLTFCTWITLSNHIKKQRGEMMIILFLHRLSRAVYPVGLCCRHYLENLIKTMSKWCNKWRESGRGIKIANQTITIFSLFMDETNWMRWDENDDPAMPRLCSFRLLQVVCG